jgi:hypothetical protein
MKWRGLWSQCVLTAGGVLASGEVAVLAGSCKEMNCSHSLQELNESSIVSLSLPLAANHDEDECGCHGLVAST